MGDLRYFQMRVIRSSIYSRVVLMKKKLIYLHF